MCMCEAYVKQVNMYHVHVACASRHAAIFLLNYVGTVWGAWDFTADHATRLAALAVELRLDGATVANPI